MNKSPCLDCRYRTLYCHSKCESYLEYRRKIDKENKHKLNKLDIENYTINTMYKMKKARNLPTYR